MNNQYNPQQPTPQQSAPQQTVPQPTSTQQTPPQQPPQQQFQQQYGQPYMQQPVYAKPPKPYVDPAVANKQKQDAINAFGDKLTDLLNTNPFLKIIADHADLISFAATGLCVLFTIIAMISSNLNLYVATLNLGGEIGGCFIFPILAIIFGGLSLCKKKMLPLTASMTAVSALMFTRFIVSIVTFATLGDLGSSLFGSSGGGSVPGGIVINFIFLIIEMGCVGFLTYICWTYFLATLPPKPVMQQTYQQPYNPQQNNMQQAAYQQPVAPQQPQAPIAPAVPQQAPVSVQTNEINTNQVCPNCQAVNNSDSLFCQKCGTKLG